MTHSDDVMLSELWQQWEALCAERQSWSRFQINRIKRGNEIGHVDHAAHHEIDRVRHVLDGLASLTMARYEFARADVDASHLSAPRL